MRRVDDEGSGELRPGFGGQQGEGSSKQQRGGSAEPSPTSPPTAAVDSEGRSGPSDAGDGSGQSGTEQIDEDFEALLADARKEKDEYLELARRTKADFENFRKRMAAEVQTASARGKGEIAVGLIGVIDNLERALLAAGIEAGAEQAPEEPLAQGIVLTHRDLCAVLERAGIESFDPKGEKFDPNLHEALSTVPAGETGPGTVVEVMQKGYRFGEQLIRPARVVVSE